MCDEPHCEQIKQHFGKKQWDCCDHCHDRGFFEVILEDKELRGCCDMVHLRDTAIIKGWAD